MTPEEAARWAHRCGPSPKTVPRAVLALEAILDEPTPVGVAAGLAYSLRLQTATARVQMLKMEAPTMSKATEFSRSKPPRPEFIKPGIKAWVNNDGTLHLVVEPAVYFEAYEALNLGRWLLDTFGDTTEARNADG